MPHGLTGTDASLTRGVVLIGRSLYTTLASSVSGSASHRARQSGPKSDKKGKAAATQQVSPTTAAAVNTFPAVAVAIGP
jgi:hypothetical protein